MIFAVRTPRSCVLRWAKPASSLQKGAVSPAAATIPAAQVQTARVAPTIVRPGWDNVPAPAEPTYRSNVNVKHTFDNFVEGKSNQLARGGASGGG